MAKCIQFCMTLVARSTLISQLYIDFHATLGFSFTTTPKPLYIKHTHTIFLWFCEADVTWRQRMQYDTAHTEHITRSHSQNNNVDNVEDSNKLHLCAFSWRWKNLNIVMEFPLQRWAAKWWQHGWNFSLALSETSFLAWVFRSLVALKMMEEKVDENKTN